MHIPRLRPFLPHPLLESYPSRRRLPFGPRCAARRRPGGSGGKETNWWAGRGHFSGSCLLFCPFAAAWTPFIRPTKDQLAGAFARHTLHASCRELPRPHHRACINKVSRRIMSLILGIIAAPPPPFWILSVRECDPSAGYGIRGGDARPCKVNKGRK